MRLVVAVITIIILILILAGFYAFSGTVYDQQTQLFEKELLDILKISEEGKRMDALKDLAKRVGAGTEHTIIGTPVRIDEKLITTPQTPITESKLVENIQYAFQTRNSHSAALASEKGNYIAYGALCATSLLAIVGLVYTRKIHIKSEKRESERLKMEQAQETDRRLAKQKANISVRLEHQKRGYYVLELQNDGAAEARDVKVYLNDEELTSIQGIQPENPNSILIGPNSSCSYHWPTGNGPRPPFKTEVKWLDDSAENGFYSTTLVHPTKSV